MFRLASRLKCSISIVFILVLVTLVIFSRSTKVNIKTPPVPTLTPTPTVTSSTPQFCGGIAAIECPEGFVCQLDGNYPDVGGQCVTSSPTPQGSSSPTPTKAAYYVCPLTEWINCMPGVGPANKNCDTDYLRWATENCPGFQGAAY